MIRESVIKTKNSELDKVVCSFDEFADHISNYDRAITLLKATRELLNKQNESFCVLNIMLETVFYDDAECDGSCLMDDIDALLEEIKECG